MFLHNKPVTATKLVVEPTHLKKVLVKLGSSSKMFRWKFKILETPKWFGVDENILFQGARILMFQPIIFQYMTAKMQYSMPARENKNTTYYPPSIWLPKTNSSHLSMQAISNLKERIIFQPSIFQVRMTVLHLHFLEAFGWNHCTGGPNHHLSWRKIQNHHGTPRAEKMVKLVEFFHRSYTNSNKYTENKNNISSMYQEHPVPRSLIFQHFFDFHFCDVFERKSLAPVIWIMSHPIHVWYMSLHLP